MSINNIVISGNLGNDPEMGNGAKTSCRFSVAVNDSRDNTTWFNVRAYENQAETCARYLNKGSGVIVVGRMASYEFTDRDGNKRRAWELIANRVQFIGAKEQDSRANNTRAQGGSTAELGWGSSNNSNRNSQGAQNWNSNNNENIPF
jgi:single-strand DNA-binding protein